MNIVGPEPWTFHGAPLNPSLENRKMKPSHMPASCWPVKNNKSSNHVVTVMFGESYKNRQELDLKSTEQRGMMGKTRTLRFSPCDSEQFDVEAELQLFPSFKCFDEFCCFVYASDDAGGRKTPFCLVLLKKKGSKLWGESAFTSSHSAPWNTTRLSHSLHLDGARSFLSLCVCAALDIWAFLKGPGELAGSITRSLKPAGEKESSFSPGRLKKYIKSVTTCAGFTVIQGREGLSVIQVISRRHGASGGGSG